MSVQVFLMSSPNAIDTTTIDDAKTVAEFDALNGPPRWDAYQWACEIMIERGGDGSSPIILSATPNDLRNLFQHLVGGVTANPDMSDRDKLRRIRLDHSAIEAAITEIEDGMTVAIYGAW